MTGLRINVKQLREGFEKRVKRVRADAFRDQIARYTKRTLQIATELTPARPLAVIEKAQRKQYANRLEYIPSIHDLEDPSLVVRDGVHWLYAGGKWYAATYRRLPDELYGVYSELLSEHDRRAQTSEADFIAGRAQARFLYKKTWGQAGASLGINVTGVSSEVRASHSRRSPPKEPAKAYGIWRGGKGILSVEIRNPFLEEESRYKPFSGKDILAKAAAIAKPAFDVECREKLARLLA